MRKLIFVNRKWRVPFFILMPLAVFWLAGLQFSFTRGMGPYEATDGTSESIVIYGARHFVDHGLWEHHLLPTYPPFGVDDTTGLPRQKEFVYNHYLAGSDLILTAWFFIFGKDAISSARMIPHTLTVLSMAAVSLAFGEFIGVSALGALLLLLLFIPRSLTVWSTCLYGHSYTTAAVLFLVAGFLWGSQSRRLRRGPAFLMGAVAGFLVTALALDWGPLTFLGIFALAVFWKEKIPVWYSMSVLSGIAAGGIGAGVYQLVLSALEFGQHGGGLFSVVDNFKDVLLLRNGVKEHPAHFIDHPWHRVLREFNKQAYGATGFTAGNLVSLSCVFLLLGFLGNAIPREKFLRGVLATIVAYVAAAVWGILMKSHAMGNMHYVLRHYFILYLFFVFVALSVSERLVMRSRMAKD